MQPCPMALLLVLLLLPVLAGAVDREAALGFTDPPNNSTFNATVATVASAPGQGSGWFFHLAADPKLLSIYASDTSAHVIRRARVGAGGPADSWEVVARREGEPGHADGPPGRSRLHRPTALCVLPHAGALVFADSLSCIRLLDGDTGEVSTLAGSCRGRPGFRDGPGSEALFGAGLRSLVCLDNCSVLVGDVGSGRLRRIDLEGGACSAGPGRGGRGALPDWLVGALWLGGAAAVLGGQSLAGTRWTAGRAAAARERLEEARAAQARHAARAEHEQETQRGLLVEEAVEEGRESGGPEAALLDVDAAPAHPPSAAAGHEGFAAAHAALSMPARGLPAAGPASSQPAAQQASRRGGAPAEEFEDLNPLRLPHT